MYTLHDSNNIIEKLKSKDNNKMIIEDSDYVEKLLSDNRNKEPSFFNSIFTLYSRGIKCFLRNKTNFISRVIRILTVFILWGIFYRRLGFDKASDLQNRLGS